MIYWIVAYANAPGRPDEVSYLSGFPDHLSGRMGEYGVTPNASQAKRFESEQKANWHARRRREWGSYVIQTSERARQASSEARGGPEPTSDESLTPKPPEEPKP